MSASSQSEDFTAGLVAASGNDRHRLLQHLHAIQREYSYIPGDAISRLADALDISETEIRGVIEFYAFLHESPRGDYDILFSDNITDWMLGSRELLDDLCTRLGVETGVPRADGRVTVGLASCTGMCDQGPAMLVNGLAVTRLDSHRIQNIATLIENRTPVSGWPRAYFEVMPNILKKGLLLESTLEPGAALRALVQQGADALLGELEQSGLRGRGGAGFQAASKWKSCRQSDAGEAGRVVACNADEGEPGTFKDRALLQCHADEVFEGMTLCAGAIGASEGILYLRGEYLYLREHLEQALQRRRDSGLLGSAILGQPDFDFDISIHMGAGAYICGEESAMIESMEGKRGVPRVRPPYPVTRGYLGRPTVVNNVETLLASAHIAARGAQWFAREGVKRSTGTKLLSISGDCERPGIYEFPLGVRVREVLEACGAHDALAVQVAGAAGNTVPSIEFDRRIAFDDLATAGSFMVFNHQRDLLDVVRNFSRFFVHESCGFCTPCRVGGALLSDLVDKVRDGRGSRYDMDELARIAEVMKYSSHCGLGTTAPNCVIDTLEKFPDIYLRRLTQHTFEPAFDLDEALGQARKITGRDDAGAHIRRDA